MIYVISDSEELRRFLIKIVHGSSYRSNSGMLEIASQLAEDGHGWSQEAKDRLDALNERLDELCSIENEDDEAKWTPRKQKALDNEAWSIVKSVYEGKYPLVAYTIIVCYGKIIADEQKTFWEVAPISMALGVGDALKEMEKERKRDARERRKVKKLLEERKRA